MTDQDDLVLPAALQGIFFPFRRDRQALWDLPTAPSLTAMIDLAWHLDLPVWSTQPPQPLYDLRPRVVMSQPERHLGHWQRLMQADLAYALDLFRYNGRWVIMDGYHRLAQHALLQSNVVAVRMHPDDLLTHVMV